LKRADRGSVKAVFGVVVVLDDQSVLALGPGGEGGASARGEHGTGGNLVSRRDEDEAGARPGDRLVADAVLINGNRDYVSAGVLEHIAVLGQVGILDRDADRPAAIAEGIDHQTKGLNGALADHHLARLADNSADAREVARHGVAKVPVAARVPVAKRPVGQLAQRLACQARPFSTRKGGEIRVAGKEVKARPGAAGVL